MEGLPSKLWVPYISDFFYFAITPMPLTVVTKLLAAVHNVAWNQWDDRNHFLHQEGNLATYVQ